LGKKKSDFDESYFGRKL